MNLLESEAALEGYHTAEGEEESIGQKRQRLSKEKVENALPPFVRDEELFDEEEQAKRQAWMRKDAEDIHALREEFATSEEKKNCWRK